ncbi:hypothetical protein D3C73_1093680 [compost metagenome]
MMLTSSGRLDSENVSAHWPNLPISPRATSIACNTCSSDTRCGYRSGSSSSSDCHLASIPGNSLNSVINWCQSNGTTTTMNTSNTPMNRANTKPTATPPGTRSRSSATTSPCIRYASTIPASTGASMPPRVSTAVNARNSRTASTTASSSEK